MLKVLIDDISNINDSNFESIFNSLPKSRKEKVQSYKNKTDSYLSLLASKLLIDGLRDLGFENEIDNIREDDNKKPHLVNNSVFISISHSGSKAMVVFSDKEIGCDIQIIKNSDISLAERFFNQSEVKEIKESAKPHDTFYMYWTLKESYMKAKGIGLALGMKNAPILNGQIFDDNYMSFSKKIDENYFISYVYKK